mmetsp:Transcript_72570/g.200163  ORF Transcript_72570/g.200163 Transcript_72570/m.200163 type:complete len:334 (+) Transcript_72570:61-1062(+)
MLLAMVVLSCVPAVLLVWLLPALAHGAAPRCEVGRTSHASNLLQTHRELASARAADSVDSSLRLEVEEGLRLSQHMQAMATQLPDGPTKSLLHSFKVCTGCSRFKRLGETNDGGYLTCMDGLVNGSIRAVYSMGVAQHDKFSHDAYELFKVPVNQFDCTVQSPAQVCPSCQFHQVCISDPDGKGGFPGKTNWPMQKVLAESGQSKAADRSLFMKMDIESAEWPILAANGSANFLKKFDQLIVEFHRLAVEGRHPEYLSAVQNLATAGFRVAHLHGNNCCGMYTKGDFSVPRVIEVTYVSRGSALAACQNPDYDKHLDAQNMRRKRELPSARLP